MSRAPGNSIVLCLFASTVALTVTSLVQKAFVVCVCFRGHDCSGNGSPLTCPHIDKVCPVDQWRQNLDLLSSARCRRRMWAQVIGGGLPVGAYGGRKDIMEMVAPAGPMYQAGTLSGNPLAMTAGIKVRCVVNCYRF